MQRDAIRTAPEVGSFHFCCPQSKKHDWELSIGWNLESGAAVERSQQIRRKRAVSSSRLVRRSVLWLGLWLRSTRACLGLHLADAALRLFLGKAGAGMPILAKRRASRGVIQQQSYGSILLAIIAAGRFAFGVYELAEGDFGSITAPSVRQAAANTGLARLRSFPATRRARMRVR